ncbi:MAG TPA: lytic transglycosylase domain-containing protein [Anaerolineae bacterium]|nr:lytic transglycosylase domain-containing protein [Anaerolineae bacterium]
MLEPIMTQLQNKLYQSVFDNLKGLLAGNSNTLNFANTGGSLQPKESAFDNLITAAAQRYNLDLSLLKAVVQAESNFSATAVSKAGAKGLMQLMDGTARELGVVDSFDPAQNIDGGARYLRNMLDRYQGNEMLALAAYNAGPGAVDHWQGLPPYSETQVYVPRILELRNQYREWKA